MTPSWREAEKNNAQKIRSSNSASNPNISNFEQRPKQSSSRHTIWDIPERKFEPSQTPTYSSSWDNKPNYFPTKTNTHFSFLPKAQTRPGAITPAYGDGATKMQSHEKSEANSVNTRKEHRQNSSSVQDVRKSCLKSHSTQSLKSRSQSPSVVKFSPKLPKRSGGQCVLYIEELILIPYLDKIKPEKLKEADLPFEWVEFRRADGKS